MTMASEAGEGRVASHRVYEMAGHVMEEGLSWGLRGAKEVGCLYVARHVRLRDGVDILLPC